MGERAARQRKHSERQREGTAREREREREGSKRVRERAVRD